MNLTIIPLKIIIFQILILLVAIATEAVIFRLQLKLSPKISLEYAAFINLLSACAGWIFFLSILSFLPENLLNSLMIYLIFGQTDEIAWRQAMVFFLIFIVSLILKLIGLQLGDLFWYKKPVKDSFKFHLQMQYLKTKQSTIAIAAHIFSHFLIFLIWLIQVKEI